MKDLTLPTLEKVIAEKSASAKRGQKEAAVAFVTYDGAAADLNELARYVDRLENAARAALSHHEDGGRAATPLAMLLFCPECGEQHIDAPEPNECMTHNAQPGGSVADHDWDNPPHKSHLCHGCGCIWRPADVPTNGVACLTSRGKADTWLVGDGAIPTEPASLEALIRLCYDDAASYPGMEQHDSGDWKYDDREDLADAIRERGIETAKGYVQRANSTPSDVVALGGEKGEAVTDCQSCDGTGSGGMGVGCTDCLGTGVDPQRGA